jgi:hypothetical protein
MLWIIGGPNFLHFSWFLAYSVVYKTRLALRKLYSFCYKNVHSDIWPIGNSIKGWKYIENISATHFFSQKMTRKNLVPSSFLKMYVKHCLTNTDSSLSWLLRSHQWQGMKNFEKCRYFRPRGRQKGQFQKWPPRKHFLLLSRDWIKSFSPFICVNSAS